VRVNIEEVARVTGRSVSHINEALSYLPADACVRETPTKGYVAAEFLPRVIALMALHARKRSTGLADLIELMGECQAGLVGSPAPSQIAPAGRPTLPTMPVMPEGFALNPYRAHLGYQYDPQQRKDMMISVKAAAYAMVKADGSHHPAESTFRQLRLSDVQLHAIVTVPDILLMTVDPSDPHYLPSRSVEPFSKKLKCIPLHAVDDLCAAWAEETATNLFQGWTR
jgi:hypothetical protein